MGLFQTRNVVTFCQVGKYITYIIGIIIFLPLTLYGQENDSIYKKINHFFLRDDFKNVVSQGAVALKTRGGKEKTSFQFLIGRAYENLNQEDSAFVYYKNALESFRGLKMLDSVAEVNYRISHILKSQNSLKIDYKPYFNEFYAYAKKTKNIKLLAKANNRLGVMNYGNDDSYVPKKYFETAYQFYEEIGDKYGQINQLISIGAVYNGRMKKRDSARYYYYKALVLYDKDTSKGKDINTKFNLYNNIGNSYKYEKDYTNALLYFKKAEAINLKKLSSKSNRILYSNLQATYYRDQQYKKAYEYLYKYDSVKNVIALEKQNASISEVEEKYDNEKLRADNLEIETKRKQSKNIKAGLRCDKESRGVS